MSVVRVEGEDGFEVVDGIVPGYGNQMVGAVILLKPETLMEVCVTQAEVGLALDIFSAGEQSPGIGPRR